MGGKPGRKASILGLQHRVLLPALGYFLPLLGVAAGPHLCCAVDHTPPLQVEGPSSGARTTSLPLWHAPTKQLAGDSAAPMTAMV